MGRVVTDNELLEASLRGERDAFGKLVERYQALVCAVSYSATGNRALSEDVAQETFIAAWNGLDTLREPGRLRSWLCGIARNLGRKAGRRTRRETPVNVATDEPLSPDSSPFDHAANAESERIAWDALQRIPPRYREALILYYREGRSARDVGASLGISENAALQRLSRGRKQLADHVARVVESSLESSRPRRGFAAAVVASLPTRSSPHVVNTQPHGEKIMLKIALVAGAIAAAGTTAIVVHQSAGTRAAAEEPALVSAQAPEQAVAAAPTLTAKHAAARSARPDAPTLPPAKKMEMAPEPDTEARVDANDIARLGLYEGPTRGPEIADVTIVVFGDFMCEFCGKVLGTIDELWDEYPGKIKLVIKQFPVHEEAKLAAQAALAADDQGKFWELHDLMYANQESLTRGDILGYADQAGLDVAALRRALDAGTYRAALDADIATGKELEIRGTPAFMINGKRFVGARPIAQFREMINGELAKLAQR